MTRNEQIGLVVVGGVLVYLVGGSLSQFSSVVIRIAQAIASAEGFHTSGSRPNRNNNPGDLTYAFGYPTSGVDGAFPIFSTVTDGWNALYTQVQEMFDGTSAYYNPGMTISQIGLLYAGGDPNWATNVASYLGVTPDTVIGGLS